MDADEVLGILVLICIAVLIYMLPAVIAFVRGHPNRWVIFALNLFLGGTGIVWLGCLIWALMAVHLSNKPGGSNGGESGLNIIANDVMHVRLEPPALLPSRALPPPLSRDTTPSQPPRQTEAIEKLERLKRLRDDDVISQEQFERMRDAIVGGAIGIGLPIL